jgi:hypothetical protein
MGVSTEMIVLRYLKDQKQQALVAQKYSAIQRARERKADIKIAQSRELAYRSVAAIPAGFMKRLAYLTTRVDGSELMRIDKLYPGMLRRCKQQNWRRTLFQLYMRNPRQPTNVPKYR